LWENFCSMKKYLRPTHIVLVVLALMYFITYLDRVNVSTAAAGFGKDFNLSKTQIGVVFSAFAYPYLIFQIIGGWVSDRFGARRTLIACGLIWAAATAITGMATGLVSLLIARVLLGFGEGATFPAATSAMSRWVVKEQRGFAQGFTHAAARIGNAAAPAVIVAIMATYGWRASFYVCALISFAWVGLWAMVFTEYPKDHSGVSPQELAELPPPRPKVAIPVPWPRLIARMLPVTIVYFWGGRRHIGRNRHRSSAQIIQAPGSGAQLHGLHLHVFDAAVPGSVDVHAQLGPIARLPVGRIFLRGNDHRSDVGDTNGHFGRALRHGQRHHEHRFRAGRHHQPGCRRLSDRCQRQLAAAVRRQHDPHGDRSRALLAHAPREKIRCPHCPGAQRRELVGQSLAVGPQFPGEPTVVPQGNRAGAGHQGGKRKFDGTDRCA